MVSDNEGRAVVFITYFAILTGIGFAGVSLWRQEQGWLGVAAGFMGIEAILCLFSENFFPAMRGSLLKAPNRIARRNAGFIGIASGMFWVLGSWPGLFR